MSFHSDSIVKNIPLSARVLCISANAFLYPMFPFLVFESPIKLLYAGTELSLNGISNTENCVNSSSLI
jgi:hypothetical protein